MGSTAQSPWYWGTLHYWLAISLKLGLVFASFSLFFFLIICLHCFLMPSMCVSVSKRMMKWSGVLEHWAQKPVFFDGAFVSVLERISLRDVLHTFTRSLCFVHTVLFLPGSAHADILKPACTQDCMGQVHSSVASVGVNTYRACQW